ncbi:DUF6233 domain-containing protein [Streptomyces chilikensis]|uniref:DUF6233 domain-containing protein n=1 Tax=Streptomyces chilikensis TaxID=1194079 RepID=A0ABV3EJ95_9ACTN
MATEERRQAEQRRGDESRPAPAAWLVEHGLNGQSAVYVHVGGCWNAGKRSAPVTQQQAMQALVDHQIPACPHCRPDTELGVLD